MTMNDYFYILYIIQVSIVWKTLHTLYTYLNNHLLLITLQ